MNIEKYFLQDLKKCEMQKVYSIRKENEKIFLGWDYNGKMNSDQRENAIRNCNIVGYTGKAFEIGKPFYYLTFLGIDIDDIEKQGFSFSDAIGIIEKTMPFAEIRKSSSGHGIHVITRIKPVRFRKEERVTEIVKKLQLPFVKEIEKQGLKVCKYDFRVFLLTKEILKNSDTIVDYTKEIEKMKEKNFDKKEVSQEKFDLSEDQKELIEILNKSGISVNLSIDGKLSYTNIYIREIYGLLKDTKFAFKTGSSMREDQPKHNNGFFLHNSERLILKAHADLKACLNLPNKIEKAKETKEETKGKKETKEETKGKKEKRQADNLIEAVLQNLKTEIRFNEITKKVEFLEDEKWQNLSQKSSIIKELLALCYFVSPCLRGDAIENCLYLIAKQKNYNPDNYISAWDGKDYIKEWTSQVELENEDLREYFEETMKKFLIGAYAKFFHDKPNEICPIISGNQGIGKKNWFFSSQIPEFRKYIVENANIEKKDTSFLASSYFACLYDFVQNKRSRLKAIISQSKDEENNKIRASFIGFSDKEFFLCEQENRRFPVFRIKKANCTDPTISVVNPIGIMSQAKSLYLSGFRYWLNLDEIAEVNKRSIEHVYRNRFVDILEKNQDVNGDNAEYIFKNLLEIADFLKIGAINRDEYNDFSEAIRNFGGVHIQKKIAGKNTKVWKILLAKKNQVPEIEEAKEKIKLLQGSFSLWEVLEKCEISSVFFSEIQKYLEENFEKVEKNKQFFYSF